MINPILRERVRYLKREEEGKKTMCGIMEKRIREARIESAQILVSDGKYSPEDIARIMKLPLTTVRKLDATKAGSLSETEERKLSGIRC